MNRFLVWASAAVLSVAGLAACDGGGGGSVVGTWTMDVDKTFDTMWPTISSKMPEGQRTDAAKAEFKKMAAANMEGLTADIRADGTFSTTSKEDGGTKVTTTTGTWKESGGQITFTPTLHDGKPPTGKNAEVKSLKKEGNLLVMSESTPMGDLKAYFRKK